MKISLTKLFAQDGKSEKYEIPLTSETFSIGGQDYRVIEKHPVILGLTHEGNRVITITGSADLTMEMCKMPDTGSDSIPARVRSAD